METLSADYTLKPSFSRIFLGDLLIFLFAYLMALVSRSIDPAIWLPRDMPGQGLVLLAGILGCLLVGGLESEKMAVRLVDGRLVGHAPFSWKPVGFPLARLDKEKTRQGLAAKPGLLKRSYLWSLDGEQIPFHPDAFTIHEVDNFLRLLSL